MLVLGWISLLVLILLALFAVANWTVLTAPASLNFLAFTVEGPLGLILLGVALALVALFAIYALSLRSSALFESRRHTKELEAQRKLAYDAETSRYIALGTHIDEQFAHVRSALDATREELLRRVDALEKSVAQSLSDTTNSLSACVGEVDDKLDRLAPQSGNARQP